MTKKQKNLYCIWQSWKQDAEVQKLEIDRAIAAYNRAVEREVIAEMEYAAWLLKHPE